MVVAIVFVVALLLSNSPGVGIGPVEYKEFVKPSGNGFAKAAILIWNTLASYREVYGDWLFISAIASGIVFALTANAQAPQFLKQLEEQWSSK